MYGQLLVTALLLGATTGLYYPYSWNRYGSPVATCELGDQLSYLPLYVVPDKEMRIREDYRAQYYTSAPALVNFIGQPQTVPAVRVVLADPIPITSWKSYIEFPTTFTILQNGQRIPLSVSALYAPISEYQLYSRPFINVLYALPPPQKTVPIIDPPPTPPSPSRNVTILHFPEAIAEPSVLFHEPPITDDELEVRNPPLPVIPAGIVQSSAPQPAVSVFVNSKESPILQLLRDESKKKYKQRK